MESKASDIQKQRIKEQGYLTIFSHKNGYDTS